MAWTASDTIFLVEDRLPWPDDGPLPDKGGQFERGTVLAGGGRYACTIRKISTVGTTVTVNLPEAQGARVALEIATGQRPTGSVAWRKGGQIGICFDRPIDVFALINRSLVSQPAERRRMPRVELRCPLHLRSGGQTEPAMLRNISAGGLQVEGDHLPPMGTFVSPFIDGLVVPSGEVVWRHGQLAGVELLEELSWTSIMPWIRSRMPKTS